MAYAALLFLRYGWHNKNMRPSQNRVSNVRTANEEWADFDGERDAADKMEYQLAKMDRWFLAIFPALFVIFNMAYWPMVMTN